MKTQIQVGQTVYLRPIGNASRYHNEIKSGTVSKVGRKYFEVEGWRLYKFHKDTLIQDNRGYSPDWQVYLSMLEIEEENEHDRLVEYFRKFFGSYGTVNLTIDQLRDMKKIAESIR